MLAGLTLLAVLTVPGHPLRTGVLRAERTAAVDLDVPVTDPGPLLDPSGAMRRPVRILVVGDSTARDFGAGLVDAAWADRELARVRVAAVDGCGLVPGGETDNLTDFTRSECDRVIQEQLPALLVDLRPDLVVVSIAGADTFPRRWDDGPLLPATDPEFARRIEESYDRFFDDVAATDIERVVWIRPAAPDDTDDHTHADGSQALVERTVRRQEGRHPGLLEIVDFRGWFEAEGLDRQPIRPDGVHILVDAVADIVDRFLLPQILDSVGVRRG